MKDPSQSIDRGFIIGGTFAVLSALCMWCVVREVTRLLPWLIDKCKELVA